jgi:hypothetical protein
VIVERTADAQTIHYRASRSVRHIPIITSITAGGESVTPYIVTAQDSGAIRKRLICQGFVWVSILVTVVIEAIFQP